MPVYRHYFCPFCRTQCERNDRRAHSRRHQLEFAEAYAQCGEELGLNITFGRSRSSLGCCYHTVQLNHADVFLIDPRRYVTDLIPALQRVLQLDFLRLVRLRVQFTLYVTFYRRRFDADDEEEDEEEEDRQEHVPFRSAMLSLTEHNLAENIDAFLSKIIPAIESYCNQNSGWILESIEGLSVAFVCGRNDSGAGITPSFTTPPSLAKVR